MWNQEHRLLSTQTNQYRGPWLFRTTDCSSRACACETFDTASTPVATVIRSNMWYSSGVLYFHAFLYLKCCLGQSCIYYTPYWICSFQHIVNTEELVSIKPFVEIWCFCQDNAEKSCKEIHEEFQAPLSGWGVSRDFLPSKLCRPTAAPLITHCSPDLSLIDK